MKKILSLSLCLIILGCSSTPKGPLYESVVLKGADVSLKQGAGIGIQIPDNGRFEDTIYKESGQQTASAFETAFKEHSKNTTLLPNCQINKCLSLAAKAKLDYFVSLEIESWEDRSTNWSGKLDRFVIKTRIYEVASGDELMFSYLHSNTALNPNAGGKVEDLLPETASQYVSSLY